MKRFISVVLCILIGIPAFSQVSLNAGYVNTTNSYDCGDSGLYLGVGMDFISCNEPRLSLYPCINIYGLFSFEQVNINTPVFLKYTFPVFNSTDLFVSSGPSVTYVIAYDWFDACMGIGFECGAVFGKLKFIISYNYGLVNISGYNEESTARLGIGYVF